MTLERDPEGHETDWIHEIVDFRGRRVLEVGAGQGRLTWRFADAARWTVGIDADPETLYFAPRECPPELRPAVFWAMAEAERLPFARETFDLALLAWSL
jgi:ubiquinone/menaquinone biosynthesis C-methylase UbiE